jgi:hypothetical protein
MNKVFVFNNLCGIADNAVIFQPSFWDHAAGYIHHGPLSFQCVMWAGDKGERSGTKEELIRRSGTNISRSFNNLPGTHVFSKQLNWGFRNAANPGWL